MEKKHKSRGQWEGVEPLCPICGRELTDNEFKAAGWNCKCGEFIPADLMIDPFTGCTHGLGCNCGRERKR